MQTHLSPTHQTSTLQFQHQHLKPKGTQGPSMICSSWGAGLRGPGDDFNILRDVAVAVGQQSEPGLAENESNRNNLPQDRSTKA